MRVHGRIQNQDGTYQWVTVETDTQGNNQYVYLTWLIQVLKLVTGESPFYADVGIPAIQSVVTQVFPDYYVAAVQSMFQAYFASLIISKVDSITPTYNVQVLFLDGTTYQGVVGM